MPRLPTDDLRIRASMPLESPAALARELPLDDAGADFVARCRRAVDEIVLGRDPRLLAVVGPCSIHDPVAALDYAQRLRAAAGRLERELLVVMRVYFEKPRTTVGWKGLINDPGLDDSFEIGRGLRLARRTMLDLTALRVPVATEFLDTTLGQYYSDLVSWAAIGARTVESQVHRELASGLSMAVGFKNRTDGNVRVAVDAIRAARSPHWFPSLTKDGTPAILGTAGNESGHLVLRGGTAGPNFAAEPVAAAIAQLAEAGLPPYLMVDCSHANSAKDAERQPAVAEAVAAQVAAGAGIMGVMLESNLVGGTQDYRSRPLVYGRSVTDPCLPLERTVPVLERLAEAVRGRQRLARRAP
jgi:3-deoxy-7-phosphoheptulonate synthase